METDIRKWLHKVGLDKYADAFVESDIAPDVLSDLTDEHLKELGVSLGDRVRLVKAIKAIDTSGSEARGSFQTADHAGALSAESREMSSETGAIAPLRRSESERRQLTVMFCDLVGSTELSTRFDPEELQEILRSYHDACAAVIRQYGGYIAKYMGDGVLVYFGYPQAHENDAKRATRAGVETVEAVARLASSLAQLDNCELAVRVGISTGLVVVGDIIGEGTAEEASVVGETPNLAARLQNLAQPNQVVIGPLTHALISDAFHCEDLGEQRLKGIAEPVRAWHVVRETAQEDDEPVLSRATFPLVGREEELGLLLRSWESCKAGRGQVVLVQGEAGIGKSRLIEALRERIAGSECLWVGVHCSPYHTNSALYPVIEHLKRAMTWQPEDDVETRLEKLKIALKSQSLPANEAVPLFADLMSLPLPEGQYPPLTLTPAQKREQTLDALAGWLLEEAERRPVLQVWEDLHWADPTTLEFLGLYIDQSPTVSMMNLLTFRPEFVPPWAMRSHMTPITLNRLERPEVEMIIKHRAGGKAMPPEVTEHVVRKADGVPLYVEELTKTILASNYLQEAPDRYMLVGSLSDVEIPATLQDTLMARLDRLPTVREVAQLGAVLGREFAYEMLRALASMEEPALRDILGQLVAEELLYQRGRPPRAKYIFKHALIQDAAYQSLLRQRRKKYHRQIAELLQEQFSEVADSHPEVLAHHFSEAEVREKAVEYWRKAGEIAVSRSANVEAVAHFSNALEALMTLPEGRERSETELALQVALAVPLMATKGLSDAGAERLYDRAQALCEELGEADKLFPILRGLWIGCLGRGQFHRAYDLAVRIAALAEKHEEQLRRALAHRALSSTLFFLGRFSEAVDQADQSIAIDDAFEHSKSGHVDLIQYGERPGIASRLYSGWALWFLGYPDSAVERFAQALVLAKKLEHAHTLAFALSFAASMRNNRRNFATALEHADAASRIAGEHNFPMWLGESTVAKGFALANLGSNEDGIGQIRTGIATLHGLGDWHHGTHWLGLLAAAYLNAGDYFNAEAALDEAAELIEKTGERYYEAEIRRVRGELLIKKSQEYQGEAEACFQQALEISREQKAKSLELRAAMSMSRLWQCQGKTSNAKDLLEPICRWFTEGFDTLDHEDANALLNELR